MKDSFRIRMISGFEKTSRRPDTPLFQVQPNGWPSMIHIKSGFPSRAAALRASVRSVIQGISVHRSPSPCGAAAVWRALNVASSRLAVETEGTSIPPNLHPVSAIVRLMAIPAMAAQKNFKGFFSGI